jgi:hypothetical protein
MADLIQPLPLSLVQVALVDQPPAPPAENSVTLVSEQIDSDLPPAEAINGEAHIADDVADDEPAADRKYQASVKRRKHTSMKPKAKTRKVL